MLILASYLPSNEESTLFYRVYSEVFPESRDPRICQPLYSKVLSTSLLRTELCGPDLSPTRSAVFRSVLFRSRNGPDETWEEYNGPDGSQLQFRTASLNTISVRVDVSSRAYTEFFPSRTILLSPVPSPVTFRSPDAAHDGISGLVKLPGDFTTS